MMKVDARVAVLATALSLSIAIPLRAAPPPPVNDTPGSAQVISSVPAIVEGSNVRGDNTITSTTITGLTSVPGPDVFYSFTPSASGTYWVTMIPWTKVPVYAAGGGVVPLPNLCVYVQRSDTGAFVGGSDANGRDLADTATVSLTAGVNYRIVVDSREVDPRGQQFEFTLVVARAPLAAADDCEDGAFISNALPTAVVGTLSGATNDYSFVEGTGRCDIVDTSGLFVPGPDAVYSFTTGPDPADAGDYVFNLIPTGQPWDGYLYIADSCPPFLPVGCLGAASHSNVAQRQAEAVVVTLDYDTTYYVFVDSATTALPNGRYVLLVDKAESYNSNESEPANDAPAGATPLDPSAINGGQVLGAADVDVWSIALAAGDRLYALVDSGSALLSSIDSELAFLAPDGFSEIEFDDDDGEGAMSPWPDFILRTSSFAATIAGAVAPAGGTYFLQVDSWSDATIARYALRYGVQPATRQPAPECESNNTLDLADGNAKAFYRGVIETAGDVDWFQFDAVAGEQVYIALDGDPERNSGGDATVDPLALNGTLSVVDPLGDVLFSKLDDASGVIAAQAPDYPAEGLAFRAPLTGTYFVQVAAGDVAGFGPGETYHLAIFRDNAVPALADVRDPVIDSITPNFGLDQLEIAASDDAAGDLGLCGASLAPGSTNLQIVSAPIVAGSPTAVVFVALVNPTVSGAGKVVIADCSGNTACAAIAIDATLPSCFGSISTPTRRTFNSTHPPLHIRDNEPNGGTLADILVAGGGIVQDVNLVVTFESAGSDNIDCYLLSPFGGVVEVITDRGGVASYDITDAAFDDSASEFMSTLSSDEPFTARWLPETPLSVCNGQESTGTWTLVAIDDSGSPSGGSRLVRWSLDIDAGFPNPQRFDGGASDVGGLSSVALINADNVQLAVAPGFAPGATSVAYSVTLINPAAPGSGTIVVTDLSENICETPVSLAGLPDANAPETSGGVSRNVSFSTEVQQNVPPNNPQGVVSIINVPAASLIGSVEADLTVNTRDVGRIAAAIGFGSGYAVLLNRVGMDERGSVGLTKDNFDLSFSDDLTAGDDAHLEPALGTIEFIGPHQPDGRGEFFGDGITDDKRDNMLFVFEGQASLGEWTLLVTDNRPQGADGIRHKVRRWGATVISPGGPERYTGSARDLYPQAGICSIALAPGASNLAVSANFAPGDHVVDYVVTLVDPTLPGDGAVVITDCANNATNLPIALAPQAADQNLPVVSGSVNQPLKKFEALATDNQPGDTGIASIQLAPFATNLQIVEVQPSLPAASASFAVTLINPLQNGRGYVRVTDGTGWRRHVLVEIDGQGPVVTGFVGRTKRYFSTDGPIDIPDNTPGGISSSILVPDADRVTDLNITLNMLHGFDDDLDVALESPTFLPLFNDIGSTGNDFIDTTLDDEADFVIPDSAAAAPFTGDWQALPPTSLTIFDSNPAAGTYTLRVVDDKVWDTGTFLNWSLLISADTFPERFDGRATDEETLGSGLCSIELLSATNLALFVEPFQPGAKIVRFGVSLVNPAQNGSGTVRVSDCAGNAFDQPVQLVGNAPPICAGDLNCDGGVNFSDIDLFVEALSYPGGAGWPYPNCPWLAGDVNGDNDVTFADIDAFVAAIGSICP